MGGYPELTNWFPTESKGLIEDLRPNIVLDWSVSIDPTQFSNPATLPQFLVLLDDHTSQPIGLSFISYTATTRRLLLAPSVDLPRGATYRVILKSGVQDVNGRYSVKDYQFTFTTAPSSVSPVTLLTPANSSIQASFPSFSWAAVPATGVVNYEFQLDRTPLFTSLDYSNVGPDLTLSPLGAFPDNTAYFWRVRAITDTVSGAWSEIRTFYSGSTAQAHDSSSQTASLREFIIPAPFGVKKLGFKMGLSNVIHWPNLSVTMTAVPASGWAEFVTIVSKDQVARNDDLTTYDEKSVNGTWALNGSTFTFTPSGAMNLNTRYEIRISEDLTDVDGRPLGTDYSAFFSSRYLPYYVDLRVIKARLRSAAAAIPDDLINYYIYLASLEANARYWSYLNGLEGIIEIPDQLLETYVRDSGNMRSYGVLRWVEATTTYELLHSMLIDNLNEVGRMRKLMDYSESLSEDFLKAIREAKDKAQKDQEYWENTLAPDDMPQAVTRYSRWSPGEMCGDDSIRNLEARRDNPFFHGEW